MLWIYIALVCIASNCYRIESKQSFSSEEACLEAAIDKMNEISTNFQLPISGKYACIKVDDRRKVEEPTNDSQHKE